MNDINSYLVFSEVVLFVDTLGGRGKKGGGFATVSSSYKVR